MSPRPKLLNAPKMGLHARACTRVLIASSHRPANSARIGTFTPNVRCVYDMKKVLAPFMSICIARIVRIMPISRSTATSVFSPTTLWRNPEAYRIIDDDAQASTSAPR